MIGDLQEKTGFFFCLEDRALLCRDCDVSIHTANKLSSNHQRFLITGTRVGLDAISVQDGAEPVPEESPRAMVPRTAAAPVPSVSKGNPLSAPKSSAKPESAAANATPASTPSWLSNSGRNSERERTKPVGTTSAIVVEQQQQQGSVFGRRNSSIPADFLSDAVPVWGVDELLNLPELADGYHMGDIGSSKVLFNCHLAISSILELFTKCISAHLFCRSAG